MCYIKMEESREQLVEQLVCIYLYTVYFAWR